MLGTEWRRISAKPRRRDGRREKKNKGRREIR